MNLKNLHFLSIILLFAGCTSPKHTTKQPNDTKFLYRIQAGINHGGIVENTEISKTNNTEVDAFTGATKIGFNAGGHVLYRIGHHTLESGLDYLNEHQTFTYNDNVNQYFGTRKIDLNQLIVPLTFNFGINHKKIEEGLFQIKLGYLAQRSFFQVNNESGSLPTYEMKNWSHGFTFGIATTPYSFENGNRIGLYFDVYRGSQIYEDIYNQDDFEMPGSSFLKTGIIYQFM